MTEEHGECFPWSDPNCCGLTPHQRTLAYGNDKVHPGKSKFVGGLENFPDHPSFND